MADIRIKDLPNATTFTSKRLALDSSGDGTESATVEALLGDVTTFTDFDKQRLQTYGIDAKLDANSNYTDEYILRIPAYLGGLKVTGMTNVRCWPSGTVTFTLRNNSTNVTGGTSIAVTTTPQNLTFTANNTLTLGQILAYTLASRTSCEYITGTFTFGP